LQPCRIGTVQQLLDEFRSARVVRARGTLRRVRSCPPAAATTLTVSITHLEDECSTVKHLGPIPQPILRFSRDVRRHEHVGLRQDAVVSAWRASIRRRRRAAARGVAVHGVSPYRLSSTGPGGRIFGYSSLSERSIVDGVALIGDALADLNVKWSSTNRTSSD